MKDNKLNFVILISEAKHFPLVDPDKFHAQMKTICEKKGFDFEKALNYYYTSHMKVQETYRTNGVHDDNEIMVAAINMNEYFKTWLNGV